MVGFNDVLVAFNILKLNLVTCRCNCRDALRTRSLSIPKYAMHDQIVSLSNSNKHTFSKLYQMYAKTHVFIFFCVLFVLCFTIGDLKTVQAESRT